MGDGRAEHTVGPGEAGAALQELAAALGPAHARCVGRGGVWAGGRRMLDPGERVAAGVTLTFRMPPGGAYAELELGADDIAYRDRWLVALHKRPGWYVGETPWDTVGNARAALGRLLAREGEAAPTVHLAHQLDRDTSGVLLLALAPEANAALHAAFAGGGVEKRYDALCADEPPWEGLGVATGHGRSAGGRWRVYPAAEIGRGLPGGGRVKAARTSFVVARRLVGAALLGAELHTGRTHQVRLHAAHVGHPLLGDARYGGPTAYAGRALSGQLLHAASLRLTHPITGAPLAIHSPRPPLFAAIAEP